MDEESKLLKELKNSIIKSRSIISQLKTEQQQLVCQLSTALYQPLLTKQKQKLQTSKLIQNNNQISSQDQKKHQRQLQKQLQISQNKLKQLKHQLKQQSKKKPKNQLQSVNELFQIDSQYRQTQMSIKNMNQQIKTLNNLKKKQQKLLINRENNLNQESNKMSKMMDELYLLRSTLEKLKQLSEKKKQEVQLKKHQVKEIQGKYISVCTRNGNKPVTFQEFKAMMKIKLKSVSQTQKRDKRQYVSIKQLIKTKQTYDNIQPTKQNLLQLRSKKQIAHHALRNAKKKHQVELRQLNKKLNSVKSQNQQLQLMLSEKQKERKTIDTRKNQSQKKGRLTPIS